MRIMLDGLPFEYASGAGIYRGCRCLYDACAAIEGEDLAVRVVHMEPLCHPLPQRARAFSLEKVRQRWGEYRTTAYGYPAAAAWWRPHVFHFPNNHYRRIGKLVRLALSRGCVVSTLHDVSPLSIPGYLEDEAAEREYRDAVSLLLQRSDLVITISEFAKRDILDHFEVPGRIEVVPYASTMPRLDREAELPACCAGPYLLAPGCYGPHKGLLELLPVLLELHASGRLNSRLILTGHPRWSSPELRSLIDDGTRSGAVVEMGYVSDELLVSMMAHASALVFPSFCEGFGLPPLEAMTVGCPVVTTPFSSLPEVCGEAALYVDPRNGREVAEALIRVTTDEPLRQELKAKGLQRAERYDWVGSATAFLNHVRQAIEPKRQGRRH